jgi:hypothetical protein
MGRKHKFPLGVDEKQKSEGSAEGNKKTNFVRLREPSDVLLYAQRLINRMRRKDLELDPEYLGKIIYLLNTWMAAYKLNLENVEIKQLREEIAELRRQMETRDHGSIIQLKNR